MNMHGLKRNLHDHLNRYKKRPFRKFNISSGEGHKKMKRILMGSAKNNSVKMSITPKAMQIIDAIAIKILTTFFRENLKTL